MSRPTRPIASLTVAALALLALGSAAALAQRDTAPKDKKARVEVNIKNLTFIPGEVTIKVGQTVRWTNNDDRDYTLMAKDQSFKSGNLRPKETFEHTFTEAGRFDYFDVLRPRVNGMIIVEEK